MAAEFNVISKKFYNRYRNYDVPTATWSLNLGEFSTRPTGNPGELLKLVEEIEVRVAVNLDRTISMQFNSTNDPTYGEFESNSLDWTGEGLYAGAVIDVFFDGISVAGVTVQEITGQNRTRLKIEKAALLAAGFTDGENRRDIQIYLASRYEYLNYKYGLTDETQTKIDFLSPFGGVEQSYRTNNIGASLKTMEFTSCEQGSNLGEVQVKFDSTTNYWNKYTVEHVFRVPYYQEGDQDAIQQSCRPARLRDVKSVKYQNAFYFGGTTNNVVGQFIDQGGRGEGSGNIGYFGENFNQAKSEYSIQNVTITNPIGGDNIDVTQVNSLYFEIVSTDPGFAGWAAGSKIVLQHTKLPYATEYQNTKEPFDDTWIFEEIEQTLGSPAVSDTIFTNLSTTTDATGLIMEVTADVQFTAAQQTKQSTVTDYALFVTVAQKDLTNADAMDRTQLAVLQTQYSKDPIFRGFIGAWQPEIFEIWNYDAGAKSHTNFDGWNGDLLGQDFTFSTNVTQDFKIEKVVFQVIIWDGSNQSWVMREIDFNIGAYQGVTVGPYTYQFVNAVQDVDLNLPNGDISGRIELVSTIPGAPTTTQSWRGNVTFEVPWREWIENLNVPTTFIDSTEPNNNLNERTSNYSGAPFQVYTNVKIRAVGPPLTGGPVEIAPVADYNLVSDGSLIADFDDPAGGTFSATTKLYDTSNNQVEDLLSDETVRIEIEFAHTLGTLNFRDLQGFIAIETQNDINNRWYLSTDKDFTSASNLLQPSNVVTPLNTQFVEIQSVSNLVTLICETKKENLTLGTEYFIYGRLGNKL